MKIDRLNHYIDMLHRPFQHPLTRVFSFLLALALSGLLLVYPNHLAASSAELSHGYLTILMWALSAAFIHGIGFYPIFWLWKIVFSPYFSWPVLLGFLFTSVV